MEPMTALRATKNRLSPEKREHRRQRRQFMGAIATGALVGGAVVGWLSSGSGSQVKRGGSVTSATVFRMTPETIDCRARTSASIESDAYKGLNLHIPNIGGGLPGIGGFIKSTESLVSKTFAPLNHTIRFDSQFRGPNGTGGGQVDTLTCAKAADMKTINNANGSVEIDIPTSAIVYKTYVVEDGSIVIPSNGIGANIGKTEWDSLPKSVASSVRRQIDVGVAETEVVARESAVNYAQQVCQVAAYKMTQMAFQDAERQIAYSQYIQAKTTNQNLTFNPNNTVVKFVGPAPTPPQEYAPLPGYHITNSLHDQCRVDGNAYQPPQYMTPDGQPITPEQLVP